MKITQWIWAAVDIIAERMRMADIGRYYRSLGLSAFEVDMAATSEMHRRIALEQFRDYASARFLQEPTLTPAEIKREYLACMDPERFKATPAIAATIVMEREAIEAMDDIFVGGAKAVHEAHLAARTERDIANLKASRRARPPHEIRARRGWS